MLSLREFKPADATTVCRWFSDEASFRKWSADRLTEYPITPQALNKYYNSNRSDDFFVLAATDGERLVGQLIMRYSDDTRSTVRLGHIIVSPDVRGKGYGKKMLIIALDYAFKALGAKRVTLGVFSNNPAALNCYKAVGFKPLPNGENQYYDILGEKWECIEMQIER